MHSLLTRAGSASLHSPSSSLSPSPLQATQVLSRDQASGALGTWPHQGPQGGCRACTEPRSWQAVWGPCELSQVHPGYICEGPSLEEEVRKGGQKEEGGQLRTPLLHCSFPNDMAKPCPVHWGCVWHEPATSAIYCQLIKLAFVISQRGRVGLCAG